MPYRIRGISTLRYTPEEMTVPRLSDNGELIEGWVRRPSGAWAPEDLTWHPPNAVKSTDVDGIGRIVDVTEGLGDLDWIRAQLDRRAKYLDVLKSRVRSGALKLTAALAKMLGLDEDGAQLVPLTGPVAYGKSAMAAAKALREEGERLMGPDRADNRHRYGLCSCHDMTGLPIIGRA